MSYKKKWCAFFSGVTATVGTTLAITGILSKSCNTLSTQALSMINTFLKSDLGVKGDLSVDLHVRNSSITVPIDLKNVALRFQIDMAQQLVSELDKLPAALESGCEAYAWNTGINYMFNLLILIAATTGVVFTYKMMTKEKDKEYGIENTDLHQPLSIRIN